MKGSWMVLRADHVAGGLFVGLGVLVIALSGDLPVGSLALPGSGFMPKILAVLTAALGVALIVRAGEGRRFAEISWSDGRHAAQVVVLTAACIALLERLGFLLTMMLLVFSLLAVVERRNALLSALYGAMVVALTYVTFEYLLRTPLVTGPFGF
jgi:hypothetical protein